MIYYIYKITNTVNGKCYIGQSVNISKRWSAHKNCKKNHPLYNSIKHYGVDNFTFEVICEISEQTEADAFEIFMIDQYHSTDRRFGYNIDLGGNGAGKISESTKQKISLSKQGEKSSTFRHDLTPEIRDQISREYAEGTTSSYKLATKYNCGQNTILRIIRKK